MDWNTARQLIAESVVEGTDLNRVGSTFRRVLEADACLSTPRFSYQGERGYRVAIGENHCIEIPWSMLEVCFAQLGEPDGYSGGFFRQRFPAQAREHPCHVHVVGRIFEVAGVAVAVGNRYFANRACVRATD
jgi:hypothetical protein